MPATNQYYRPTQTPYVSQYADYKLPYEAIQNAVLQRQTKFDTMQSMPGQMAAKFGSLSARSADAEGVQRAIDGYLGNVNQMVDEKFGGDWSLAGGEIYNKTAEFTADPMWKHVTDAYQQQQMHLESQKKASDQGLEYYTYNAGDDPRNRLDPDNISVFNEDGSLRDVKYKGTTRVDQRPIYEQYFNNKKASSYGQQDKINQIQSLKARTGSDDAAFVALVEKEGVNFSDGYIANAADQYIKNGGLDYKIYLDQGYSPDQAKALVVRNMTNSAEEYEYNKSNVQPLGVPQWNPGSGSGNNKMPSIGEPITTDENVSNRFPLVDKDGEEVIIESVSDVNKQLRHAAARGDNETVEKLQEMQKEASEQLIMQNPKAAKAHKNYQETLVQTMTPLVEGNIEYLESQGIEFETPEAKEKFSSMLMAMSDPTLANDSQQSESIGNLFSHGVKQFMSFLKTVGGPIGTPSTLLASAELGGLNEKEYLEQVLENAQSADPNKDPSENMARLVNIAQARPELFGMVKTRDGMDYAMAFAKKASNSIVPGSASITDAAYGDNYREFLKGKRSETYKKSKEQLKEAYQIKQRDYDSPLNELITSESQASKLDVNIISNDGKYVDGLENLFTKNIGDDFKKAKGWDDLSNENKEIIAKQLRNLNYKDVIGSDKGKLRYEPSKGQWLAAYPVVGKNNEMLGIAEWPVSKQYQQMLFNDTPFGMKYDPISYGDRQVSQGKQYAEMYESVLPVDGLSSKTMSKAEASALSKEGFRDNPRVVYKVEKDGEFKTLTYGDVYDMLSGVADQFGAESVMGALGLNDGYPYAHHRGVPFSKTNPANDRPVYYNDPLLYRVAEILKANQ